MWQLPEGERALTEVEWALFRVGIDPLRFFIESDIGSQSNLAAVGVPVFDRLTPEQKLVLLADTTRALRDPEGAPPDLTAANEGAVAAVFVMLQFVVDSELDNGVVGKAGVRTTEIRRMLLAACAEGCEEREEPLPKETCDDHDEWHGLVEEFRTLFFWDEDYLEGDVFLDLPPERTRAVMDEVGIDSDYYLAVPDEPDRARLTAARQTLARLLGLPVLDDDGHYPTLMDLYHNLLVGPCSPEQTAAWKGRAWVEAVGLCWRRWDCDYATWEARLGEALPPTLFRPAPVLKGKAPKLPSSVWVECRGGGGWVVRNKHGSYWCGLVENCWTDEAGSVDVWALTFPTKDEAAAAYRQAARMYRERDKRHKQALALLRQKDKQGSVRRPIAGAP